MATIGIFTANADGSYSGAIHTLTMNLKAVQFRPVANKPRDKSPDFRVYAGKAELGVAWKQTSKDNNAYLSVKLDDLSFDAPINTALLLIDGEYNLVWSRPEPKTEEG